MQRQTARLKLASHMADGAYRWSHYRIWGRRLASVIAGGKSTTMTETSPKNEGKN